MKRLLLSVSVLLCFAGLLPNFCFAQSKDAVAANSAEASTLETGELAVSATSAEADSPRDIQPGAALVPEPAAPQQPTGYSGTFRVGIGIKVSTLGIGGEVAVRLADRINLRGGVNGFAVSPKFSEDGIAYDGGVKLISADAHLDLFLFRSFRVSPGLLFYNGNNVNALASVPGGQTFTVGGTEYESSTADPIAGSGKITFTRVAPEFTIGTGNLVPRGHRRWSINSEFGFAFTGAAKVALGLTGSACLPPFSAGPTCMSASSGTVAAQVQAQQTNFNNQASSHAYYKFWPVLSVGFGYSF